MGCGERSGDPPADRHSVVILEVAFFPDGGRLLSVADDDTVREWRVDTDSESLLEWTRLNRFTPELTAYEREYYRIEP